MLRTILQVVPVSAQDISTRFPGRPALFAVTAFVPRSPSGGHLLHVCGASEMGMTACGLIRLGREWRLTPELGVDKLLPRDAFAPVSPTILRWPA